MRIKLLSTLAGLFFVTLAVTSCLDSDNNNVEYSSDDTIKAFRLDTIYGVKYNFTIDQINRRIFNVDSVPFSSDTIINKILIDSLSVNGWVTIEKNGQDTIFTYTTDSLDFSNTMPDLGGTPVKLKVHAYDGVNSREYSIEVRRHQQEPDSLVWSTPSLSFSQGNADGLQKTIILKNQLITYVSNQVAYTSNLPFGSSWTVQSLSGLSEENIKMTSFLLYKDKIYCVAESGKVFQSPDGLSWQEAPISGNVVALIGAFPDYISGLVMEEGKTKFATTNSSFNGWDADKEIPATFPTENISMASFKTNTNEEVYKYILMGKSTDKTPGKTIPWFSFDGKQWASLATDIYYCPEMEIPTIIYYNETLYAFGGDFTKFYTSQDQGRIWKGIDKMVMFPDKFRGRKTYSTVIDPDNYIWIIWSKGLAEYTETDDDDDEITITTPYDDEVWKGRINRLGFLIK